MKLDNFINFNVLIKSNDIFLYLIKSINLLFVINYFKNKINYLFVYLVDIFVCDYIYYVSRFRITYNLSSFYIKNNFFFNESIKILDKYISLYKIFKSSI